MNRRDFLVLSTAASIAPLALWRSAAAAEGGSTRLVVVLLRGAVDGLNVVVPYGEAAYYAARPTIHIPKPDAAEGAALALDEHFALHPALAGVMPLWQANQLAFVHAAGSPDPTRSHFDAQLFIENGTPGRRVTEDGWINRLVASLPGPHGPADALAVGPTLPFILKGKAASANIPLGPAATRKLAIDRPEVAAAFDRLYAGDDPVGRAYRQGRAVRTELTASMNSEQQMADGGARRQTISRPRRRGSPASSPRIAASGSPSPRSAAGTPMSARVAIPASWPIGCARWATALPPWRKGLAATGPIRSLSCSPNLAARRMKMATPAPITGMAM